MSLKPSIMKDIIVRLIFDKLILKLQSKQITIYPLHPYQNSLT